MKVRGTLLKFGVENSDHSIISSDCKIDIPEKVPILFDVTDFTKLPVGYAEVVRTDEGLIFTGEFNDHKVNHKMIKECTGCGGYYNCVERDESNVVVKMKLRSVSCTYAPVNPEYKFEIVEEEGGK